MQSAGLASTMVLTACATVGHLPRGPGGPAWPPAPEPPRLRVLGEFRGAADLGLEGGLGRAALRFLAGARVPELSRPYAVAVFGAAPGTSAVDDERLGPARLAVTDTQARAVFVFDLAGGETKVLDTAAERPLEAPVGVAFDAAGRLYVCDSSRAQILRWSAELTFDRIVAGEFERPAGVAIDPVRGVLYVADAAQHVVRKFDLEGVPRGAVALPFAFPTHLAVDVQGRLLVSDSMDFQVLVISPEGERLAALGQVGDGSGDLQRPKGVAADSEGHVYVADAIFDNLQVFGLDGRFLLAAGSAGNGPGEFALPAGVAADPRDVLYVADTYNGRIVVLQYVREPQAGEGRP